MRRLLPLLVLALAGCGGESVDADQVLTQTASKLPAIKSAESLELKLLVSPREGEPFGFEITGPFACGETTLPKLDVEYTRIANGQEGSVRLVADGERGYVVVGDTAYEMTEEQAADLSGACADLESDGGLAQVRVDDWVVDPEGTRDGDVDRVEGELDVVAVVNGLVDVARAFGGSALSRLDADDAKKLADAAEETAFELETGRDDRLLRYLLLEAELGFEVPESLREALGDVGATFSFELKLDGPNEPVSVEAPADPRPASELPGSEG